MVLTVQLNLLNLLSVPFERSVMKNIETPFVAQSKVYSVAVAESIDYVEGVFSYGVVQCRVAVRVLEIYVTTVPKKNSHATGVLLVNGHVKSAATAGVHSVDRRTPSEQQLHHFRLISVWEHSF